jgi:hypothetical protein
MTSSYQQYREWLKKREQGLVPPAKTTTSRYEKSSQWTYLQQLQRDIHDGIA